MNRASRTLAIILVGVFLFLGLGRLQFDTNVLSLLPADLPSVRALVLQQLHFASSGELIMTIRGESAEEVEAGCRSLAERLRGSEGEARWVLWTPPWEERPDLAAELLAAAWMNGSPEAVRALYQSLDTNHLKDHLDTERNRLATSLSPSEVARAGYDPLGLLRVTELSDLHLGTGPRFASEDGRFRIVIVTPREGFGGYQSANAWMTRVRRLVANWQSEAPGRESLRIRLTGGPAFTEEISLGMERDMRGSVLGTAVVIGGLFAWAHRRVRPLVVLMALLALTLVFTLAAGGLLLGRLNAISLGSAAILLGLAVDFGLVLYQEALAYPNRSPAEIRRGAGPGVVWAAITTAAAFGALAFGGLPGLMQLGVLVGCGVLVAAVIMLNLFLSPRLLGNIQARPIHVVWLPDRAAILLTWVGIGIVTAVLVWRGIPSVDATTAPFRPRHSEVFAAMEEMDRLVGGGSLDASLIIASGPDEASVAHQLRSAESILESSEGSSSPVTPHQLPTAFWPDPPRQAQNRPVLAAIAADRVRLREAIHAAGFNDDAMQSANAVLDTWERAGATRSPFWPTNDVSAWVLGQVTSREPPTEGSHRFFALGSVAADSNAGSQERLNRLRDAGLLVGDWNLLGTELLGRVESRLPWVVGLTALVWLGSLGIAFRSIRETLLAVAAILLSFLVLLAWMAVARWNWNLMNLMALPVLVGAGTDYAIHIQLALQRHRGDLAAVHRGTGRAVFLCAATTVAGFGSLAGSSNEALASLGITCAAGLAICYAVSSHLVPGWWRLAHRGIARDVSRPARTADGQFGGPSALYRASGWRAAIATARVLPRAWLAHAAAAASVVYAALAPKRRRIVAANLLPILGEDANAARRAAWRTFSAFGRKLADLWIYEAGESPDQFFTDLTGWNHFEDARTGGRGVLFLGLHLGNWELGGALLTARGVKLLVLTIAEPGDALTDLRRAARARWGIETLVVGDEPFALVEVIRKLQDGAVVALLIDRPPRRNAVQVEWFGRPFAASTAAAELARTSGCILLPFIVPANAAGYTAHLLPPVPYERAVLGTAEARRNLTRHILRAFEPHVRQHATQWYQFVPVWPAASPAEGLAAPSPSAPVSS